MEKQPKKGAIRVEENDRHLIITGEAFEYTYSKLTGMFIQMKHDGQEMLDRPMEVNIWRAPTDNDRKRKEVWQNAHYHESMTRAYETSWESKDSEVVIQSTMSVQAVTVQRILDLNVVWTIDSESMTGVRMLAKKDMEFPELPRFGLRLFLKKELDQVSYYGMGPEESYADKHRASSHGLYSSAVSHMHEDYIRPQENGSHYDCDYVMVQNEQKQFMAVSDRPFSFNVSPYTQEELTEKKHNYELEACGSTVLCLDYAQNGIGSNSCGPDLLEKYQFNEEEFVFEIQFQFQPRIMG